MTKRRDLVPLPTRQEQHESKQDVDFAVSIKVRNGRILAAIKRAGYRSVLSFCKQHGLAQGTINGYVTMTLSPVSTLHGRPTRTAQLVADLLNAEVEDLFPPRFMATCLSRIARTQIPLTEGQIGMLLREPPRTPEDVLALDQAAAQVSDVLTLLPPREERLLRLRYALGLDQRNPQTLEEVGEQYKLTRERVRQIEESGIRKLRHPKRKKRLIEAASTLGIGEFVVEGNWEWLKHRDMGIKKPAPEKYGPPPPPKPTDEVVWARSAKKVVFPPTAQAPEPDWQRLLHTPWVERDQHIERAIAYHLEEEFVRRGGTRIRPNDDFLATWEAMNEDAKRLFKYNWFMSHWSQLWALFPPAPMFYVEIQPPRKETEQ